MPDLIYKDYVVNYHHRGQHWTGTILPPKGNVMTDFPKATEAEGETIFIARAKTLIDRDIANLDA